MDYEKQIILDLLEGSSLVIMSRGLGLDVIFSDVIKIYCDPSGLVLILNTNWIEQQHMISQLAMNNIQCLPKSVMSSEYLAKDREVLYLEGGVLFLSSQILVMDILRKCCPVTKITGIIAYNAHKLNELTMEAFILRLYREQNKTGFIHGFSDQPELFIHNMSQLDRVMKCLFARNLHLWPRFHASVKSLLDTAKPTVNEIHIKLTNNMEKIQFAIIDLIKLIISALKKRIPSLCDFDKGQLTVEMCLSQNIAHSIRYRLDSMWTHVSAKCKLLIEDLTTLRKLLFSTIQHDPITLFYKLLQIKSQVDSSTIHQATAHEWVFMEPANTLFSAAAERLFGPGEHSNKPLPPSKLMIEENPKWKVLSEIVNETMKNESAVQKILIVVDDFKTKIFLENYLKENNGREQLEDLYNTLIYTPSEPALEGNKQPMGIKSYYKRGKQKQHLSFNSNNEKKIKLSNSLKSTEIQTKLDLYTGDKIPPNSPDLLEEDMTIDSAFMDIRGASQQTLEEYTLTSEGDMTIFEENMPTLKGDMPTLKGDMPTLKEDMPTIKGDTPILEGDSPILEEYATTLQKNTPTLKGDMPILEEDMSTLQGDMPILEEAMSTLPFKIISLAGYCYPHQISNLLSDYACTTVILYDIDIGFIRQLERYQFLNKNISLNVYFLIYKDSAEEQKYLTNLRQEKESFEKLIKEKSFMVIPEDREGREITCNYLSRDPSGPIPDILTHVKGGRRELKERRVIVDVREFKSILPALLHKRGLEIIPVSLDVGDYILTPDICIERKSISDLIGSLNSGRLFNQVTSISRHYKRPVLLIESKEGEQLCLDKSIQQTTYDVSGKLVLLTIHFPKLRIIWCESPQTSAEMFDELKKEQPEPDIQTARSIGTDIDTLLNDEPSMHMNNNMIDFLLKIPGVTYYNVKLLVKSIKDINELISMNETELSQIVKNELNGKLVFDFLHRKIASTDIK